MLSDKPMPEPPHRQMLRRTSAALGEVEARLAKLVIHDADGTEQAMSLSANWQAMPGRVGVDIFHVPDPDGEPGLYLAICRIAAGTSFDGGHIDHSQLIALLEGELNCNGRRYVAGNVLWLAPGEPTSWQVGQRYLAAIRYNVPPHDLDPALLPTS